MAAELTFIGTATTLLQVGPFTVLTIPASCIAVSGLTWDMACGRNAWPRPPWAPAELPPVDVIVLSHLHGDHWAGGPGPTWTAHCPW
jgi:L-ascorbate metabolism protein UlaG (beta-lactamase superfamily)